ncbi:MAG: hypothetical protein RhofKO_21710 [Rhodothermales bacterium]
MKLLSRSEELILLAVWRLQDDAYGVQIRKHLAEVTGEDWAIGSVYVPLDRMTKRRLLRSYQGAPTAERGGRSKRYYELTPKGVAALQEVQRVQHAMWASFPNLALDT